MIVLIHILVSIIKINRNFCEFYLPTMTLICPIYFDYLLLLLFEVNF
jgi:hypothetical protein